MTFTDDLDADLYFERARERREQLLDDFDFAPEVTPEPEVEQLGLFNQENS